MAGPRIGIDGRYIQDHFPGIGRYAYNLVRALGETEHEAEIVVFVNERLPNSRYDLRALAGRNVRLHPLSVATLGFAEQVAVRREAARLGLALYHAPYYVRPYFLPCPVITTIHDVNSARLPASLPSRRARLAFRFATALALRTSRMVLTASRFAARDLIDLFHVPPEKIAVTGYAADGRYRPGLAGGPEAAAVRERYRLPSHFLLYLGINKPLKNLERLVEAYALVLASLRDAGDPPDSLPHLVLAGREDARYPQARHKAAQWQVDAWVHFPGEIAELDQPYLYSLAGLFVFPSLMEGFGLPPLEAMSCGTPVVCSHATSLPEVVGEAAVTFDPLSVPEMAAAILKVWANPSEREKRRELSLARARRFSWRRTAEETFAVYRRVLEGGGK